MIFKKTILSSVLAGAAFACATPPPPPPPPPPPKVEAPRAIPKDNFAAGNEHFVAKKYDQALTAYDQFLAKNPKHPAARYNRALTLQELGRHKEAESAYEDLLSDEPGHAEAAINLGSLYKKKGEADRAIDLYEKFLKKDPFNSRVLNNQVALFRDQKQYGKAIKAVRTLLMRDQNNIDAYKNLALVYYDQEKYKLTQTILANAMTMAKKAGVKDPDIAVNMGLTHLKLGDNARAMAAFKEARTIEPEHVLANYNIGALALAHRDYGLAASSFTVAEKEWPNDFEVVASLGFAYQGLQEYDKAEKMLRRAAEIDEDENVLLQLMIVLQAAEKPKDAMTVADRLMAKKGLTCGEEDFEGLCGRINGIKLMMQMAAQPAPAPEEKPKATGNVEGMFSDEEPPPEEAAPEGGAGAEGGTDAAGEPGAEGTDAPAPEGQ